MAKRNKRTEAAKAAAYAVTILHNVIEVESVNINGRTGSRHGVEIPEDFPLLPDLWFNPQYDLENPQFYFIDIAILAAEIIAMRPEKRGHGPRWDAIDLEGLEIAARLVRIPPEKSDPLFAVGNSACGDWWNDTRRPEMRPHWEQCGENKILNWWREAMELVRHYRPQIDMLADALWRGGRCMDGEELRELLEPTISGSFSKAA